MYEQINSQFLSLGKTFADAAVKAQGVALAGFEKIADVLREEERIRELRGENFGKGNPKPESEGSRRLLAAAAGGRVRPDVAHRHAAQHQAMVHGAVHGRWLCGRLRGAVAGQATAQHANEVAGGLEAAAGQGHSAPDR